MLCSAADASRPASVQLRHQTDAVELKNWRRANGMQQQQPESRLRGVLKSRQSASVWRFIDNARCTQTQLTGSWVWLEADQPMSSSGRAQNSNLPSQSGKLGNYFSLPLWIVEKKTNRLSTGLTWKLLSQQAHTSVLHNYVLMDAIPFSDSLFRGPVWRKVIDRRPSAIITKWNVPCIICVFYCEVKIQSSWRVWVYWWHYTQHSHYNPSTK